MTSLLSLMSCFSSTAVNLPVLFLKLFQVFHVYTIDLSKNCTIYKKTKPYILLKEDKSLRNTQSSRSVKKLFFSLCFKIENGAAEVSSYHANSTRDVAQIFFSSCVSNKLW